MTHAQTLAQQLFDKAVEPIMDLQLTDETIKSKGIELALIILDEIYNRNTGCINNDVYCDAANALNEDDISF